MLDAQVAFDRGDFATVKRRLRPILDEDTTSEIRRDACALMARVGNDRAAVVLTIGCVIFFLAVVAQYVL